MTIASKLNHKTNKKSKNKFDDAPEKTNTTKKKLKGARDAAAACAAGLASRGGATGARSKVDSAENDRRIRSQETTGFPTIRKRRLALADRFARDTSVGLFVCRTYTCRSIQRERN